ncbi:hypothetical protein [Rhodovibrio salinarum]|uniref:hypothetical protein n=1 Tax=Rhodovibrio salinarum TaxID=1087 RepID=UPI0004B27807|nr:hypothetical protein [Rhodovibrio salinarum]
MTDSAHIPDIDSGHNAFATGQADTLLRLFDVSSHTAQSRGTGRARGKTSFQPES